jgi:hypothetical protein
VPSSAGWSVVRVDLCIVFCAYRLWPANDG